MWARTRIHAVQREYGSTVDPLKVRSKCSICLLCTQNHLSLKRMSTYTARRTAVINLVEKRSNGGAFKTYYENEIAYYKILCAFAYHSQTSRAEGQSLFPLSRQWLQKTAVVFKKNWKTTWTNPYVENKSKKKRLWQDYFQYCCHCNNVANMHLNLWNAHQINQKNSQNDRKNNKKKVFIPLGSISF